jgi:hypothetical protein
MRFVLLFSLHPSLQVPWHFGTAYWDRLSSWWKKGGRRKKPPPEAAKKEETYPISSRPPPTERGREQTTTNMNKTKARKVKQLSPSDFFKYLGVSFTLVFTASLDSKNNGGGEEKPTTLPW